MNEFNRGFGAVDVRSMDTSVNAGLRTFMLGVYQKLALGIALSGGVAFLVGSGLVPGLTQLLLGTPLFYLFQFGLHQIGSQIARFVYTQSSVFGGDPRAYGSLSLFIRIGYCWRDLRVLR